MEYTVIYPSGQQQQFYLRSVAELYASLHKGRVVGKPTLTVVERKAA